MVIHILVIESFNEVQKVSGEQKIDLDTQVVIHVTKWLSKWMFA